jgi:quercetin dioxygenase-like cupin family protein
MRHARLAGLALALAAASVLAQKPAFKRTVLQKTDLSIPGREAVMGKAELPPGASSGRHTHPGEELGYILEGSVQLTVEGVDGGSRTLKAGDSFVIPAGQVHDATNAGAGTATVVSTYVVEKGKPVATPVK